VVRKRSPCYALIHEIANTHWIEWFRKDLRVRRDRTEANGDEGKAITLKNLI